MVYTGKPFAFTLTIAQVHDLFSLFDAARSGLAQVERFGLPTFGTVNVADVRAMVVSLHEALRDQWDAAQRCPECGDVWKIHGEPGHICPWRMAGLHAPRKIEDRQGSEVCGTCGHLWALHDEPGGSGRICRHYAPTGYGHGHGGYDCDCTVPYRGGAPVKIGGDK